MKQLAKQTSADKAFLASRNWWSDFWRKSYIYVDIPEDPEFAHQLTQSYILQHYIQAGSGRGNFPIKFNGSIFTTDPKYTNASTDYSPDYRNWGNDFGGRIRVYRIMRCCQVGILNRCKPCLIFI